MLTEQQAIERKKYLGASDAPAVLGVDPFGRTPACVWREKTGRSPGAEETRPMRLGKYFELPAIHYAADEIGLSININTETIVHPSGLLCCHLDGLVEDGSIVEAKLSNFPAEWGDEGTDEVPENYLVQVAHQFACVPAAQVCWMPVVMPIGGRVECRLFKINRNNELVEQVVAAGIEFMERYVKRDVPPPDFIASLDVLKRQRRNVGMSVPISRELIEKLEAAKAIEKEAVTIRERAEAELLTALGDTEIGACDGKPVVAYPLQTMRRIDAKRLERERPDVVAQYMIETQYRVLRLKTHNRKEG